MLAYTTLYIVMYKPIDEIGTTSITILYIYIYIYIYIIIFISWSNVHKWCIYTYSVLGCLFLRYSNERVTYVHTTCIQLLRIVRLAYFSMWDIRQQCNEPRGLHQSVSQTPVWKFLLPPTAATARVAWAAIRLSVYSCVYSCYWLYSQMYHHRTGHCTRGTVLRALNEIHPSTKHPCSPCAFQDAGGWWWVPV